MVANTLLEIYTLMFGWNMYEAIWDVLVGSGLALVPFIVAIISNFKDNYSTGEAAQTIRSMETTLLGMILVLMLCVLPYKGFSTQLSTVRYELGVPDCNAPSNISGTGNNVSPAYNSTFSDLSGWQVHKPVAWSFVEFLSTAITHTTIKSMTCVNNYEYMLMRISNVSIQSERLREEVQQFNEVCYQKAIARFRENPPTPELPANVTPWANIDWMGSHILLGYLDEYYEHPSAYMHRMEDKGFTRQTVMRQSDQVNEFGANPSCKEVWLGEESLGGGVNASLGLRHKLLNDLPMDEAGDILGDWKTWGFNVFTTTNVTEELKEDMILKLVLQNNAANLKSSTDVDMSNNFEAEQSRWRSVLDKIFDIANVGTSANEFLQANSIRQMFKIAGPMILVMLQMVIILAAPFVMLFGNYGLVSFFGLALTYFSLEFINAIWAAAYWFDNRILDMYGSQAGGFDEATNSLLISTVATSSILLLPMVWLSVMAYAGAGMLRGISGGGVAGGTAAGATGFSRGVGGAAAGGMAAARGAGRVASKMGGRSGRP